MALVRQVFLVSFFAKGALRSSGKRDILGLLGQSRYIGWGLWVS